MKQGGREDRKGAVPQASPEVFPLQCQERYVSGRCLRAKLSTSTNCGSLFLTKALPSLPPDSLPKLDGIFPKILCFQTCRAIP